MKFIGKKTNKKMLYDEFIKIFCKYEYLSIEIYIIRPILLLLIWLIGNGNYLILYPQ